MSRTTMNYRDISIASLNGQPLHTFEVKSLFVGLDSQRWLSFTLEDLLLKIEPARRDSPHVKP